jgi:hypothetical protein
MLFENHTPFPAIAWLNVDNQGKEYSSTVVRVKYLFDTMDEEGIWTLKLDPDQGELFGEDMFYEDDMEASVQYESDYVAYKPYADLIVNAYAHTPEPRDFWTCGVKAIRYTNDTQEAITLVEQWLKVYGKRYWQDNITGWGVGKAKPTKKVSLRYENAFGGVVLDPNLDKEDDNAYVEYYDSNPVGKGVIHKILAKKGNIELPQIEAVNDPVVKPYTPYVPQGLGFIHRSWHPRRILAGTFDKKWEQYKHPLMPDDYQETHNNAAHPNLQLKEKGYFQVGDIIVLHKLLLGKETQAFQIPGIYFKPKYHLDKEELPYYLEIDTVIVDILEDNIKDNAIYISYRKRVHYSNKVEKISLSMIVSKNFIENPPKDETKREEVTHG